VSFLNDFRQTVHTTAGLVDDIHTAYETLTDTHPSLSDPAIDHYHETTQAYLHSIDEFTVAVDHALNTATTTTTSTTYQPRHETTTSLTNILDGRAAHTCNDRYNDFTDVLPDTYHETDAAYLHGYLDANPYLNEHHSDLLSDFHRSLNDATRRRY
jgi:hypothetical protein